VARDLRTMRGLARTASMASSVAISVEVRTVSGAASGVARADMVRKKMRQLTIATRKELGQSLGGLKPRLFGAAARLHHLVKHFRFPAQGVPFELLDGDGEISDRQIGHQLPVDRRTPRRRVDLKGLDVGEKLRTVSLLLADGRQGLDRGELHVHACTHAVSSRPIAT
jgi:hypothetical protein